MKGRGAFFLQAAACIGFCSFALYSYLEEQNKCTELGMRLPKIVKEIQALNEENAQLRFQIVSFESPEHLLSLTQTTDYAHLKFPLAQDVLKAKVGLALQLPAEEEDSVIASTPRSTTLVAAK